MYFSGGTRGIDGELMDSGSSRFVGWQGVVFALALIVAAWPSTTDCRAAGVALLLQQSPAQGGTITPGEGIHQFEANSEITLTAVPRPGYRFVYWLGDVSDPRAVSTAVNLDGSKVVIAVFEPFEYGLGDEPEYMPAAGGGGGGSSGGAGGNGTGGTIIGGGGGSGGLFTSAADYGGQVFLGIDIAEPQGPSTPGPGAITVVPEPVTLLLLGLGGLIFRRRR